MRSFLSGTTKQADITTLRMPQMCGQRDLDNSQSKKSRRTANVTANIRRATMTRDENQNVEYKESWCDKCLEWICGYANATGGIL